MSHGMDEMKKERVKKKKRVHMNWSQAYFWTSKWQKGEQETDEDIRRGNVKVFPGIKALIKELRCS